MSKRYPRGVYRTPFRRGVRQGDIAIAEFHQLRSLSGSEPKGPGAEAHTTNLLPYLGEYEDFEILPSQGGTAATRVLRLWQGPVMVLHQNCEFEFGDPEDSRLIIAPIVSRDRWPEGPWDALSENRLPGYLFLPGLNADEARQVELADEWPESSVVLASSTLSSVNLIKPRRILALTMEMLPHLQDAMMRFCAVRGFNNMQALENLRGKRLVDVQETDRTVVGPSRLVKLYFSESRDEADDGDDEATLTFFGTRT